jgi:phosphate transport system substrate-binding protein
MFNITRSQRVAAVLLACTLLAGCSGKKDDKSGDGKKDGGEKVTLQGNGATFPDNIYQAWFAAYGKKNPHVQVNYQAEGSGAGIAAFQKGTVFFAGSDAVTPKDLEKIKDNLVTLPMTAGSIVIAYSVKGEDGNPIRGLKLSRKAYADIFRGAITKWNDPAIKEHNKDAKLPDRTISVVHRSDSSGTTFSFTHHLSTISPDFKKDVGQGKTVSWPMSEKFSGAKGNAGVMSQIKQSDGAIGYVEYGFATENDLTMATLENRKGQFVEPTEKSGVAGLAAYKLPDDFRLTTPDPEGDDAYPIVTYTWLLAKQKYDDGDAAKVARLKELLRWCLSDEGQKMAPGKGYIPLPKEVTEKVVKAVDGIQP